jgi:hypothetical protein
MHGREHVSSPATKEGKLVDWACKKCKHPQTVERGTEDGVYEDYQYTCLKCGYSWWEEGADA